VFRPSFGDTSGSGAQGLPAIVRCQGTGEDHSRLETGSEPVLSGVGARIDPCSRGG
jgi:hypothetical protein